MDEYDASWWITVTKKMNAQLMDWFVVVVAYMYNTNCVHTYLVSLSCLLPYRWGRRRYYFCSNCDPVYVHACCCCWCCWNRLKLNPPKKNQIKNTIAINSKRIKTTINAVKMFTKETHSIVIRQDWVSLRPVATQFRKRLPLLDRPVPPNCAPHFPFHFVTLPLLYERIRKYAGGRNAQILASMIK